MNEKIRETAARIHELRELSDISAAEMARRLEVPLKTYTEYESGRTDIPASVLFSVAHELGVDMKVLLTGKEPHMNIYTVTRKGKGVVVKRQADYDYQHLAANFQHRKSEPFLVAVQPNPPGTQVSINHHPGQEFDYILEGTLKITIHSQEIVLEEGDSIFFDSNYGHGMEALNDVPARFLAIIF